MIPTAAQVYDKAQIILGDDEVSGGDVYTDAYLATHLQSAVNMLFRALTAADSPLINRTIYVQIARYQTYLDLDDINATDCAAVVLIRASTIQLSGSITGLTYTSSQWRITSASHGLTSGDIVYISGVTKGPDEFFNTQWAVEVIDANTFYPVGAPSKTAADATYVSGGTWAKTAGGWSYPYNETATGQDVNEGSLSWRPSYDFREGGIHLEKHDSALLLEFTYRSKSENIVATAPNLRVRGSLDFLGYCTAGLAALAKGADSTAAMCLARATGSSTLSDVNEANPGGLLGDLAQEHSQAARAIAYTQRYRPYRRRYWW